MKSLSRRQSTARLVARLLDDPGLSARIRSLPPSTIHQLVRAVGLEDSAELVALATTEQLTSLFDADLWTNERAGEEERFDAARFVTWLEVLAEVGLDHAAARLGESSEEFLAFALSRLVLVVEFDALRSEAEDDEDERVEKLLSNQLYEELGEYFVIARVHEGWDTLLGILLSWDRDDHALLERLLGRLANAGEREMDERGGLSEVLSDLETLEEDAAAEREERRARAGYVEPRSAVAFLRLARREPPANPEQDAVSRAYFRALAAERSETTRATQAAQVAQTEPLVGDGGQPLLALLAASAEPADAVRELPSGERSPLRAALRSLAERNPQLHARHLDELAFLTNVLVSGEVREQARWRPEEALEEVVRIVESVLPANPNEAFALVERWGPVGVFRRGYYETEKS